MTDGGPSQAARLWSSVSAVSFAKCVAASARLRCLQSECAVGGGGGGGAGEDSAQLNIVILAYSAASRIYEFILFLSVVPSGSKFPRIKRLDLPRRVDDMSQCWCCKT